MSCGSTSTRVQTPCNTILSSNYSCSASTTPVVHEALVRLMLPRRLSLCGDDAISVEQCADP